VILGGSFADPKVRFEFVDAASSSDGGTGGIVKNKTIAPKK
jgi:hypothetical protein